MAVRKQINDGLLMQKTVRYQINACVRTCRIQRNNPDGVFFIRRGIDDAEDGALSRTHKKISRLLAITVCLSF